MKVPRSSPVAGTNEIRVLSTTPAQNLSREPVADPGQVWQALAQAAAALFAAASAMAGKDASLPGAVSLPLPTPPDGCTVINLINDFLMAKARAGRSDRYLRTLRVSLLSFAKGRKNLDARQVTVEDLEAWMNRNGWGPRTKRGYLSDVRTLYNFARKRNLVSFNPAAAVELPELDPPRPSIHTPDQVAKVLEFARGYDINLCRALAVRYFAGLRSAEVDRLEEPEIRERFIEVTAAKSKTRARRLIPVAGNLTAWLALGGSLPIRDPNNRWRWFTAALAKEHAIPWPSNVTRHSFVSYHLAHHDNAGKTAIQAGHTEQMLFAHYRELVTAEAAAAYWALVPGGLKQPDLPGVNGQDDGSGCPIRQTSA